jgi:transposase
MRHEYPIFNVGIQGRSDALADLRGAKKINNAYRQEVSGRRGRPYADLDATLHGVWWIACTGAMWNQLPSRFGKWNSVWRCFRRWCASGLWKWSLQNLSRHHSQFEVTLMLDATHVKAHQDAARHPLSAEAQKLGKTKGGCNTKISMVVNLLGLPLSFKLVCGNEHDSVSAVATISGLVGGNLVLADKGYDNNALRDYIRENGGLPVIPPRANRTAPVYYPRDVGKWRHKVENYFARLKRFRRISTRYDKLPETYLGFVSLAAIVHWVEFDFVHVA